ncbi:unnamed protein product [Auanema sp. JU1783]|nr:unnamed protein product [Auanema sp. JU1783]
MTRLIVKNLPTNSTEKSVREYFKKYGNITDCSLKYTKEGKFRKFAFLGFETDSIANKVLSSCDGVFMGSYKLQVDKCHPFGSTDKPRAWSIYAKDSSAFKRKHGEQPTETTEGPSSKKQKDEEAENPELEKFLEATGVSKKKEPELAIVPPSQEEQELLDELLQSIEGDTSLSLIFRGLPASIKAKSIKEWVTPVRVKALKVQNGKTASVAFVTFNRPPDVRRAMLRNNDFLGGYRVTITEVAKEEEVEEEIADPRGNDVPDVDRETEEARIREEILDTGRLFLRNLPFATGEDDIRELFKPYGEISDVQVIIDKKTGNCKGFGIVEFMFPENAVAAYAENDGQIFKGRMLHILPGTEKREAPKDKEVEQAGSNFKKEKAAKLKANAGKAHSWNALFLGPNAIADTLAEKLGVDKSDLLLGESGESAGVRLALAETRLVREVRDYLLANGVKLDAFSRPSTKRSKTIILAKNLPAGVTEDEIQRLFIRHGEVNKVLLPPEGGITALIVMGNEVDAKKAFNSLAYSRFRTQPLYLEWAPVDAFGGEAKKASEEDTEEKVEEESEEPKKNKRDMTYEEKKELKQKKKKKKGEAAIVKDETSEDPEMKEAKKEETEEEETQNEAVEEKSEEQETEGIDAGCAVFVKNLSFDTTDESLHKFFSKKFRIKSAKVSRKLNPGDPSKNLSMGFGFVHFYTPEAAEECIKNLQGELLEGHSLELKLSHRTEVDKDSLKRKSINAAKQGQCTKLLVRNIPFQAKIKEVENLFATFGEIKDIRIPRKVGNREQHRGFGFVDFLSVGEAKRAFEALVHSTHLYGRRLVLEWAKSDDTVEELREKTAEKFRGDKAATKKQKQRLLAIEKDLERIEDENADP